MFHDFTPNQYHYRLLCFCRARRQHLVARAPTFSLCVVSRKRTSVWQQGHEELSLLALLHTDVKHWYASSTPHTVTKSVSVTRRVLQTNFAGQFLVSILFKIFVFIFPIYYF